MVQGTQPSDRMEHRQYQASSNGHSKLLDILTNQQRTQPGNQRQDTSYSSTIDDMLDQEKETSTKDTTMKRLAKYWNIERTAVGR